MMDKEYSLYKEQEIVYMLTGKFLSIEEIAQEKNPLKNKEGG